MIQPKPLRISLYSLSRYLLISLIIGITISFLVVDGLNMIYHSQVIYPAYAKPVVSLLCLLIVLIAMQNNLGRTDYLLLLFSFISIVIVDLCMSIYVYGSNAAAANIAFLIGAVLSIVAHILLVVRHSRGFGFLKPFRISRLVFPAYFFFPVVVIFILLCPQLIRVNQFWPSLGYAVILTGSLWVAWEAFRHHSFPGRNRWLIALGITSWFITELIGVVHNIDVGFLSEIAMVLTWVFYMPGILLLALSGHNPSPNRQEPQVK